MGRPTKLTPEVQRRIVRAVGAGNTRRVAAEAAGVDEATLYRWLQRGAQPRAQKLYREFREAVAKAEALAVQAAVGVIRHAGRTSWQAMAWWLERRFPDEWGRKDRMEVEHLIAQQAERMASELGLNKEDVLAETERILASHG